MNWRRLVPLSLAVVALLAVVAVAARGRPLGTSGAAGGGLPTTFWDFVFTTALILFVFLGVASFVIYFSLVGRSQSGRRRFAGRTMVQLGTLLAITALLAFVGFYISPKFLFHPNSTTSTTPAITITTPHIPTGKTAPPHVQFRWEELVAILGALLVLGIIGATRSRRRAALTRLWAAEKALATAVEESLDDLRADPDLRRAIVAAYARMETALAAAGLPREPAEAPLEYLERVLLALHTSAGAVRRLTNLFEWARFSQHEPEPAMRDEAVDALVAVRDELRARELVVT